METLKELIELSQSAFAELSIVIYDTYGIDLVEVLQSPILKIIMATYCISVFILMIQKLRKKYDFYYTLSELGELMGYTLWGAPGLVAIIATFIEWEKVKESIGSPIIIIILFLLLTLWLWEKPIKFVSENICKYGILGFVYSYALLGFGIFGLLYLLSYLFVMSVITLFPIVLCGLLCAIASPNKELNEQDEDETELY